VSEDGFTLAAAGGHACAPHDADYAPQDWRVLLGELLRSVQFFNSRGYTVCEGSEDGYCPVL
jgi:hypothetical protein